MKYWIRTLKHQGINCARQLVDVADCVHDALQLLGKDVSYDEGDQQIVIGGNLAYPALKPVIPDDAIIYNLEQAGTFHFSPEYIRLLRRCPRLWDYNEINAARMKELYGATMTVVPIGYVPSMTHTLPETTQDIDVSFTGSTFALQRQIVLQAMLRRGLTVFFSNNCYGPHKDEIFARSKVVLNMHYHKEKIMETLRIGAALANKKTVLCQVDSDTAAEKDIVEACHSVPYDKLADEAVMLAKNPELCREIAERGHEIFKKRWMPDILEKVL